MAFVSSSGKQERRRNLVGVCCLHLSFMTELDGNEQMGSKLVKRGNGSFQKNNNKNYLTIFGRLFSSGLPLYNIKLTRKWLSGE
jgi:hypothetical protein